MLLRESIGNRRSCERLPEKNSHQPELENCVDESCNTVRLGVQNPNARARRARGVVAWTRRRLLLSAFYGRAGLISEGTLGFWPFGPEQTRAPTCHEFENDCPRCFPFLTVSLEMLELLQAPDLEIALGQILPLHGRPLLRARAGVSVRGIRIEALIDQACQIRQQPCHLLSCILNQHIAKRQR